LIPALLLVRGQQLDSPSPGYYAVTVARGLQVQLLRVAGGAATSLGQLQSADYVSGAWVKATVLANGSNVRAQIFRLDKGQYLDNTGHWQAAPTWALNVTDSGVSGGGFAGVGRPGSYPGTVYFDDFSTQPATGDST